MYTTKYCLWLISRLTQSHFFLLICYIKLRLLLLFFSKMSCCNYSHIMPHAYAKCNKKHLTVQNSKDSHLKDSSKCDAPDLHFNDSGGLTVKRKPLEQGLNCMHTLLL